MGQRPTLSVVIITQDRAEWLRRSMESVAEVADEFVIVDGGSRDHTKEVVASFPRARLFERPWPGDYGDQKNWAFERATGDWILSLDHDERMGANFRASVRRLMRAKRRDSYQFPRYNLVSDAPLRYIRNDLLDSIKLRRLFRNEPRFRYQPGREGGDRTGKVHHGFPREACGRPVTVPDCHIFHFNLVWATDDDRVAKVEQYNRAEPFWTDLNTRFTLYEDFPHEIADCDEALDGPGPVWARDGAVGSVARVAKRIGEAIASAASVVRAAPARWPFRAQRVSACILAVEGPEPLRAAMASAASLVDEIIVVDREERAEIRAVVASFPNARYFARAEDREGPRWNFAFEQARCPWILELRADERVGAGMRRRLPKLVRSARRSSYTFHRYTLVSADPPRYAKTEVLDEERHCRLFRNKARFRYAEVPSPSRNRTGAVSSVYDRVRRGRSKDVKDCHLFGFDHLLHGRAEREALVRSLTEQYPPLRPLYERHHLFEDRPHEVCDCEESL